MHSQYVVLDDFSKSDAGLRPVLLWGVDRLFLMNACNSTWCWNCIETNIHTVEENFLHQRWREDIQYQTEINREIYYVLHSQVVEDDDFEVNGIKKFNIDDCFREKIKIDSNEKQAVFSLFKNHKQLFSTDLKDL